MNYNSKLWQRILQDEVTLIEKEKHLTDGMQLILRKRFNLNQNQEIYQSIYIFFGMYQKLVQDINFQKIENKKKTLFAVITNFFIPLFSQAINVVEIRELFTAKENPIHKVIMFYMEKNRISTYESLAQHLSGNYEANLKLIHRIKQSQYIPRFEFFNKFYNFTPLLILASVVKSFYILSDNYFGKNITADFKNHFLDLGEKYPESFLDNRLFRTVKTSTYQEVYFSAFGSLVTENSETIIDNIEETISKSQDSLTIVKDWNETIPQNGEKYSVEFNKLDMLLNESTKKDLSTKDEVFKLLNIADKDSIFYPLFMAKHLLANQDFTDSVKFYEKAIQHFQYVEKKYLNDILKEFLMLLAYLENRRKFNKVFQLFQARVQTGADSTTHFYWLQTKSKTIYNENHFYEKFVQKEMKVSSKISIGNQTIKLDLKNIDKIIKADLGGRDLPQLIFLISQSKNFNKEIELLLKNGADVNKKASDNSTALMRAIQSKNFQIAYLLLENPLIYKTINVKTKMNQTTSLIATLQSGNLELLKKFVLIKGLKLDGHFGESPILYFLITLLDKRLPSEFKMIFPLSKSTILNQIDILVENGININFFTTTGSLKNEKWEYSPLMYACELGETELITLFVKNGADMNLKNRANISAQDILNETKMNAFRNNK